MELQWNCVIVTTKEGITRDCLMVDIIITLLNFDDPQGMPAHPMYITSLNKSKTNFLNIFFIWGQTLLKKNSSKKNAGQIVILPQCFINEFSSFHVVTW